MLSGADAGNYTVNGSASAAANITPAILLVSATGVNKVYDATTGATVILSAHPLSGDVAEPSSQEQVSAVQPASGQLVGTVSVFVPVDLIASGKPFSFSLPEELYGSPEDEVLVTRMNRKNLPSWLIFKQDSKTFRSKAIPAGALPIDLLVTTGGKRWKVKITDWPNAQ